MPEGSYYPDVGDKRGPPNAAGENADVDAGQTALLPKSILAGKDFNPGDELVLKVVHIYDDEVEVEYATESKETKPAGPTADEEIEGMSRMGEMAGMRGE